MTAARALAGAPRPAPSALAGAGERAWAWPIDPTGYDRAPRLTASEVDALATLGDHVRAWPHDMSRQLAWRAVDRLVRPLANARAVLTSQTPRQHRCADAAVAALLRMCRLEGAPYWVWSTSTWVRILGATQSGFRDAHPPWVERQVRHYLIALAYLLRCVTDLRPLGHYKREALAAKIFGPDRVRAAIERLDVPLRSWGYRDPKDGRAFPRVLCEALLHQGSPRLTDLSLEVLRDLRATAGPDTHALLFQVQRGLAALGLMEAPIGSAGSRPEVHGVDPTWCAWVTRWEATSTVAAATRKQIRLCVLKVGRWLASEHPTVVDPGTWTRELCAAYVAAVDHMHLGEYAQRQDAIHAGRLGDPLSARSKEAYLGTLRHFFRDAQEWGWIPRRFDPGRALATPRAVKALIGPRPRVIADALWAKLLWAGLNLEARDLVARASARYCYPIELVRALTIVWLFSGLRSDEIARLRVGCVRWQRAEDGADAVCLLDVPSHKTGTPFTKPVDSLVGRAIDTWHAVRPTQPPLLDRRTGERVALLFCLRAKPVAREYVNQAIIPALCRKAGVPRTDARGRLTSHRARSTIASQLYNAKEPMTLFELQAWLGHRSPQSTQHYTQITPTRLAQAYADAGYFSRNLRTIDVLIDREAVQTGAAAAGTPWQYFDLGHGYCTYNFFEQCPHRMACARCDFYLPKASTRAQLLEAKASLQRMLLTIPLTDDERAAVDEGADAVERLLTRLADTPTPAGPTPRETVPPPGALLSIKPHHRPEGA